MKALRYVMLLATLGAGYLFAEDHGFSSVVLSRDGTTMETNGIITPLDQDMRNFYIRNNDGVIEVQLKADAEVGLQARVQRNAWESDALVPEFRTAEQMSLAIPDEVYVKVWFKNLKTAESTMGKRDLFGGRTYFTPIPEHVPTEEEPWLAGRVTEFHEGNSLKTITVGGKEFRVSTKGHDNADIVIGALGVSDIKPFQQQAFVRGEMVGSVFHADEVTLRPLPIKEEDPKLGRYLFIGDSISGNYDRALRQALKGKLNLVHPPTNCGPTRKGLENMGQWLGPYDVDGRGWDVISFNFGHWDSGNDKETYQQNLEEIIAMLRKTEAKLIFVTTCPIPNGYPAAPNPTENRNGPDQAPGRAAGTMEKYLNPWALEVMSGHPDITVCDQHTLIETEKFYQAWMAHAGNAEGKGSEYGDLHVPGLLAEPIGRQLGRAVLDVLGRTEEPLTSAEIREQDLDPERQRKATQGMDVSAVRRRNFRRQFQRQSPLQHALHRPHRRRHQLPP
ncbi:MAG: SGNH/GDSL hydrolase family protein, partial [Verrucomicrobiota bacterium]